MKILFEGYRYSFGEDLQSLQYRLCPENDNIVNHVGYFYSDDLKDSVFVFPKVFIKDDKAFGIIPYQEEITLNLDEYTDMLKDEKTLSDDEKHENLETIYSLSFWIYQAIARYKERHPDTILPETCDIQDVESVGDYRCATLVDVVQSLRKFHRDHKYLFTYMIKINHSGYNKIHWGKTISKVQPLIIDNSPYYLNFKVKNKTVNFDEELIVLFYSVLNYLKDKYYFTEELDLNYNLISPTNIEGMIECGQGTLLLNKIRRKYFTDELVALWKLLYAFFEKHEKIKCEKYHDEEMLISSFEKVFEDMIDQLIGDENIYGEFRELKNQKDGKVIDHLFKGNSLINSDEIYFIGDSKYYKEKTDLSTNSVYKQFTYAKNIIQYNIDIFNKDGRYDDKLYYRDELTEGYNITPNFFIRASAIGDDGKIMSYDDENLINEFDTDKKVDGNKLVNFHFANRLFDRDTLVLQTYDINFLYVLAKYVEGADKSVQNSIRNKFREDLIKRFNLLYDFAILRPRYDEDIEQTVNRNFRKILGKVIRPYQDDEILIMALDKTADCSSLKEELSADFQFIPFELGTDFEKKKSICINIRYGMQQYRWRLKMRLDIQPQQVRCLTC